jgi:hypothetical protein
MNTEQRLAALGAAVPEILIPGEGINLARWAVIACDQFTQDRRYWEKAGTAAGTAPSALHCVLPEAFLSDQDSRWRISNIHRAMASYLDAGIFVPRRGCVYIERDTPSRSGRRGLLLCVDLERYDWKDAGAPALVRPTEGTVPERLPLRMDIRRGAPLELSHTLVLIDDEPGTLLPALGERAKLSAPLYDTPLEPAAGRVRGWLLDTEADLVVLTEALERLFRASSARHGAAGKAVAPFLYAVGDGNHSLAAAKAVWDEYKQGHAGETGIENHPARWALVEIENLYDPALVFEPIHRFVYGADIDDLEQLRRAMPGVSLKKSGDDRERFLARVTDTANGGYSGFVLGKAGGLSLYLAETGPMPQALDRIQSLLDRLVASREGRSLDYIHGEDEIFRLASGRGGLGIILPSLEKRDFFRLVSSRGIFPRKCFSLGRAEEKRYYLECRRLFAREPLP